MEPLPEGFDPAYYLLVHGDVGDSGMDPAEHWMRFGRAEGRTGVPPVLLHSMEQELHDRMVFFRKAWTALTVNGISGAYVEFGAGHGKTMWCSWRSSRALGRRPQLWAFDSFEGLPESEHPADRSHPAWGVGRFAVGLDRFQAQCTSMGIHADEITSVVGYFRKTLDPARDADLPSDIALAFVDCDLYESSAEVLAFLRPRLKHGMILAFDDWFCWSPSEPSGEMVALEELVAATPEFEFRRFVDIGWHGTSFVVLRRVAS